MSYQPKRQEYDTERGLDDWLMTYADMITLLLCFFAVFLAVSVPKEDAFVKARETVLETFSQEDQQGSLGEKDNKKPVNAIFF